MVVTGSEEEMLVGKIAVAAVSGWAAVAIIAAEGSCTSPEQVEALEPAGGAGVEGAGVEGEGVEGEALDPAEGVEVEAAESVGEGEA